MRRSALRPALLLLCLCTAGLVHAQPPFQPGYQPWQFRPVPPSNARGMPPSPPQAEESPTAADPSAAGSTSATAAQPAAPPRAQMPPYALGQPFQPGYPQGQMPPMQTRPAQTWPGPPQASPAQPGQWQPSAPGTGQVSGSPTTPPQIQPNQLRPGQMQSAQPGRYTPGPYQPPQKQTGAYPGYGAPYGSAYSSPYSQSGLAPAARPRLELVVDEREPYVQQNVLLRLRVISNGNLATASPQVDGIADMLFKQIEGPNTSTRTGAGGPEIVNEYVLAMTPLREGLVEVGPIKVTGTLAAGVPFEATAPRALELRVRPAIATVRPWLALRTLRIDAELEETDAMSRGRPATLSVELVAEGAVGDQLPSLEPMLRSEDFRVYREQTLTDTRLDDTERTLIGKRIEVYTLVPQSGGRLQLPELRLNWWNVETASREASSVPIRVFDVAGESGPFGFAASTRTSSPGAWRAYWLPVAGIGLLLLGYWGGAWLRSRLPAEERRPLWRGVKDLAVVTARGGAAGLRWLAGVLNPAPLLRWLRGRLAQLAPASTRVYQCAKAADATDDPAAWCLAFQQHACRRLSTSAREPLPRMADRIVTLRPGADRQRVQQLMLELDRALYNRTDIDFRRWKRDFHRALRPGTGILRGLTTDRVRRAKLPELNPRPAT